MATLYFNATADNTWNNLSNWWQDNAFTIPATAIPAAGDTVYKPMHNIPVSQRIAMS